MQKLQIHVQTLLVASYDHARVKKWFKFMCYIGTHQTHMGCVFKVDSRLKFGAQQLPFSEFSVNRAALKYLMLY